MVGKRNIMVKEKFFDKSKKIALLIDPDRYTDKSLDFLLKNSYSGSLDFIFVGGSLTTSSVDTLIDKIKKISKTHVILFPGNPLQVSLNADAILFLSLISGRNPEFLIGNHVLTSVMVKKSGMEVIPTGYILIDCGTITSVEYMSNTKPIPPTKADIVVSTAVAGQLLGMQAIYLEAGSGADNHVSENLIETVKKNISVPLIVGGGISTVEDLELVYKAGADIAVVGTAIENNPALLKKFLDFKNNFCCR